MENTELKKEKAILVGVNRANIKNNIENSTEESLRELERLADTARAETVMHVLQKRNAIDIATYIGKGKAEEIKIACESFGADLVIFDDELTGIQLRNLEDIIGARVIDRSALILDIFASRANTKEGKIQVELAQLKYRLPRLTGQGLTLSRLGGGIGTRGPGETKLETDKRHIKRRIESLEGELDKIKKHRELIRSQRKKNNIPVAALVGYTNAGKSSLLNRLTDANVLAENKLFATLDPTVRKLGLRNDSEILLIDTVGFIRKLPHHLIEAFKSTLEEAVLADVLIHVIDASSDEIDEQVKVVNMLLKQLGALNKPIITVYNKIDLKKDFIDFLPAEGSSEYRVEVSVLTGEGMEELVSLIENIILGQKINVKICIPYDSAKILSKIHEKAEIIKSEYIEKGIIMDIYVSKDMFEDIKEYVISKK